MTLTVHISGNVSISTTITLFGFRLGIVYTTLQVSSMKNTTLHFTLFFTYSYFIMCGHFVRIGHITSHLGLAEPNANAKPNYLIFPVQVHHKLQHCVGGFCLFRSINIMLLMMYRDSFLAFVN